MGMLEDNKPFKLLRAPRNSDPKEEFDINREGEDHMRSLADWNYESDTDSDDSDADEGPAFADNTIN